MNDWTARVILPGGDDAREAIERDRLNATDAARGTRRNAALLERRTFRTTPAKRALRGLAT